MTYQHIVSYLTVLGRSIWTSRPVREGQLEVPCENHRQVRDCFCLSSRKPNVSSFGHGSSETLGRMGGWWTLPPWIGRFFAESTQVIVGTEVEVQLKETLSRHAGEDLVRAFFLYIDESVALPANLAMPKTLKDVPLVPSTSLSRGLFWDMSRKEEIGGTRFTLRTMFCYSYRKHDKTRIFPGLHVSISATPGSRCSSRRASC